MSIRWLLLALSFALPISAHAAEPDATTRKEVTYLMDRLASSGCQFNRNGSW